MRLIQILLPTRDNEGEVFPPSLFARVRAELTEACGGVTAYVRAPATGLWDDGDRVVQDDILIYEVMADAPDPDWWQGYRRTLEERFRQDEIVIRSLPMEKL